MYDSAHHGGIPELVNDEPTRPHRPFSDRHSAGRALGRALLDYTGRDGVVIGIAPGGLIVAGEVARALQMPLEVWIVRDFGLPATRHLPRGSLAEGASLVLDGEQVARSSRRRTHVVDLVRNAADDIRERARRYRGSRPRVDVRNRLVIVIADVVVATRSVRATIRALAKCGASEIVVAIPVCAHDALEELAGEPVHSICLVSPEHLADPASWYDDFHAVSDGEIVEALKSKRRFAPLVPRRA